MKRTFVFLLVTVSIVTVALSQACKRKNNQPIPSSNIQKEFINPEGLSNSPAYTQVVAIHSGRMIYISGQVPLNAKGEIVGKGDLRAQAQQVFENLKIALAGAGVTFEDVIKVNYYIKNYKPEHLPIIRELRTQYFSKEHPPCATLVGVQSLFLEDVLIEIEAIASAK